MQRTQRTFIIHSYLKLQCGGNLASEQKAENLRCHHHRVRRIGRHGRQRVDRTRPRSSGVGSRAARKPDARYVATSVALSGYVSRRGAAELERERAMDAEHSFQL